jgi:NAD(P)-dependent dehydrogenase (short-subunit alcohol dehydrogenase family)
LLFAQEGAQVAVWDRNAAGAAATVEEVRAAGGRALDVRADVTRASEVEEAAAQTLAALGRVDVLVNNAGFSVGDGVLETDEAEWNANLAVILNGAFLCTKAVLPAMLARRQGAIVNISSVNGLWGLGEEGYSAAKAGLINFTKNLAVRYGRRGIRANVICPGTVRTPIWEPVLAKSPDTLVTLARWYPLGRVGEPDDIARAALFLASDAAAWITGAVLPVDGGLTAGLGRMAVELQGDEVS